MKNMNKAHVDSTVINVIYFYACKYESVNEFLKCVDKVSSMDYYMF